MNPLANNTSPKTLSNYDSIIVILSLHLPFSELNADTNL